MVTIKVNVNIKPLLKLEGDFKSIRRVPSHPAIEDMFTQWAARYSAAMIRRFNTFSRGGGDWRPLAQSTLAKRRSGGQANFRKDRGARSQRSFAAFDTRRGMLVQADKAYSILKDTGALFGALTIGARGNLTQRGRGTITFGIEGGLSGKGTTIGQIARYHQSGGGRLPKREILVQPSPSTVRAMATDSRRAAERIVKEMQRGA